MSFIDRLDPLNEIRKEHNLNSFNKSIYGLVDLFFHAYNMKKVADFATVGLKNNTLSSIENCTDALNNFNYMLKKKSGIFWDLGGESDLGPPFSENPAHWYTFVKNSTNMTIFFVLNVRIPDSIGKDGCAGIFHDNFVKNEDNITLGAYADRAIEASGILLKGVCRIAKAMKIKELDGLATSMDVFCSKKLSWKSNADAELCNDTVFDRGVLDEIVTLDFTNVNSVDFNNTFSSCFD
ncbi:hypothetical protein Cyrtocomes_00155 [Candidatus Cyrtobacter comes]|uniref:Uncharacterized protein n=1 Tax=Candidatus Cyrtobacter comes TaxID=675776 RepID=A0ABU5L6X3_9RICK|nr:hypothetical protein [Candidatus Cyrtobacter comes]MDZ5761797.1 hypothetical protein [Candidatus Cyrtobacter comes]